MKKSKNESFFLMIRDFLTVYLPEQICYSQNTIKAYKDVINLLLDYMIKTEKIPILNIDFPIIDSKMVIRFLDWTENERGCCSNTRNQRLSCIRSFFKYSARMEPILNCYWNDLQQIPLKKTTKSTVLEFMSEVALKAVLS